MFSIKTIYPAGFEPGSSVPKADAISTVPRRATRLNVAIHHLCTYKVFNDHRNRKFRFGGILPLDLQNSPPAIGFYLTGACPRGRNERLWSNIDMTTLADILCCILSTRRCQRDIFSQFSTKISHFRAEQQKKNFFLFLPLFCTRFFNLTSFTLRTFCLPTFWTFCPPTFCLPTFCYPTFC
jgi:hypothetical protein